MNIVLVVYMFCAKIFVKVDERKWYKVKMSQEA